MRAVWCGFAIGVWWLQQQAMLPGGWVVAVLLATCTLLVAAAVWCLRVEASPDVAAAGSGSESSVCSVSSALAALVHGVIATLRGYRCRHIAGWLAVALAAACAGFLYAAARADARLALALPTELEGRDVDVRGFVKGLPTRDDNGVRFLFAVESTEPPVEGFPALVQLAWMVERVREPQPSTPSPAIPLLAPGERWQLRVRLKRPHGYANFGGRDSEASLLARNVRATGYVSTPGAALRLPGIASGVGVFFDRWRAAIRTRIDGVLRDAPHRGIVTALATGAQDAIRDADWQLMRRTGTSHLVAISGLHLGFVAGLAAWLAGALWRRSCYVGRDWPLRLPAPYVATCTGLVVAALHAGLAGFNVPAQRVLWMLAIVGLASVSGRSVATSVVLAWALGLVLVVDPWAVLSAGFWLSFCAVAAIAFALSGAPRSRRDGPATWVPDAASLDGVADTRRAARWRACLAQLREAWATLRQRLANGARVQFAVTVALAPLSALWFAQIPLIGPVANAFAIPWVSVAVTPVVLAGVVLPAPFDVIAFQFAHRLLDALMWALQCVTGPAWTVWHLRAPDGWTLALAMPGVLWCLAPRGWPLRCAAPLAWLPLVLPPDTAPEHGRFRLTALDIGQGASILVETAHHRLLFDAGPGPESTHAGERIVVPTLRANGIGQLDTLIVSHADSDHAGGAPAVFDGLRVDQLLAALPPAHPLWEQAGAARADGLRCASGQRWQWDGVEFAVLWPPPGPLTGKTNAHCCVLQVRTVGAALGAASAHTALIAADIEAAEERTLVNRLHGALRADVLLVPHHGSKTSSTEPFLDSVEPRIAVFQVGYRNRFHHPNAGVWARYEGRHIELARSDTDGAVRIDETAAGWLLDRYRDTHRRYWMGR